MKNYTGSEVYYGMIVDILSEIERISDLRFQLNVTQDSKYGVLTNETWNGLIGQLIDHVSCVLIPFTTVCMTYCDIHKQLLLLNAICNPSSIHSQTEIVNSKWSHLYILIIVLTIATVTSNS